MLPRPIALAVLERAELHCCPSLLPNARGVSKSGYWPDGPDFGERTPFGAPSPSATLPTRQPLENGQGLAHPHLAGILSTCNRVVGVAETPVRPGGATSR